MSDAFDQFKKFSDNLVVNTKLFIKSKIIRDEDSIRLTKNT